MPRVKSEELRIRCLDGAILLMTEIGPNFTMSELASALKISKKTLYVYFSDKEDLLLGAVDRWFDQVKVAERAILEDEGLSTLEKMRRIIAVQPAQYPLLSWSEVAPMTAKYPRVYDRVLQRLETEWEPTIGLMEHGIATGEFRRFDVDMARALIEGAFEYLLTHPLKREHWHRYLEEMVDIVIFGVAARGDDEEKE